MSEIHTTGHEMVKCEVCLTEIPASEAKSAEAYDYIAHFCGLDCYQKWLVLSERKVASAK